MKIEQPFEVGFSIWVSKVNTMSLCLDLSMVVE
jgi:hypothetical protein